MNEDRKRDEIIQSVVSTLARLGKEPVDSLLMKAWVIALEGLTWQQIQRAFEKILRGQEDSGSYKAIILDPGRFVRCVVRAEDEYPFIATEIFATLLQKIESKGSKSVFFFEDQYAAKALQMIGGLKVFRTVLEKDVPYLRAEFVKSYTYYRKKGGKHYPILNDHNIGNSNYNQVYIGEEHPSPDMQEQRIKNFITLAQERANGKKPQKLLN